MTDDAILVVQAIFSNVWRLFNSWYIPGTNVTPAVALFGLAFVSVVIRFLPSVLGLWVDDFSRRGDDE